MMESTFRLNALFAMSFLVVFCLSSPPPFHLLQCYVEEKSFAPENGGVAGAP